MAQNSKIEWTGVTWNPLAGCDKKSAGCKNCYAMFMAFRLINMGQKKYEGVVEKTAGGKLNWTGKINLDYSSLKIPYKWKRPKVVFVNSMSDLFHKDVPLDFIQQVFKVMNDTPQHTYQVLTKRADRLLLLNGFLNWTPNIWMGVSVEDALVLDRVIYLQQTSAVIKFLSIEPQIGPLYNVNLTGIHWVIQGGESGHHKRPFDLNWAYSMKEQCNAAGIPYFFKQIDKVQPIPEDLLIREFPTN